MPKIRAVINSDKVVNKQRQLLYKNSLRQLKKAISEEYYLEAIALLDSLIADRLESRIGELTNKNVQFNPLGKLCKDLLRVENMHAIIEIIEKEIIPWVKTRNISIHESVKIEAGKDKLWEKFCEDKKSSGEDGYKIFRKLDYQILKQRRNNLIPSQI